MSLKFTRVPPEFANAVGAVQIYDDGQHCVTMSFEPGGGKQASLASGTDVVVVLDASFSMFARAYRNGKVLGLVDSMIGFMSPYDDDGIDVFLHSLRKDPFLHLGAFASADEVIPVFGDYMETKTAMRIMGQRTVCAPVLHEIVRMLKEEKGSDRVFIEMLTDGVFDDEDEVRAAILQYGRKYNNEEAPFGIRFHFTGVGAEGARGLAFLDSLDNDLEGTYEGFIDCVQHNHADTVEENVESILDELQKTVQLDVANAMLSVSSTNAQASHITDANYEKGWSEGSDLSWEGGMPIRLSIGALFPHNPGAITVTLAYLNAETDEFEEHEITAELV